VDGAGQPVDWFCFLYKTRALGRGEAARIRKLREIRPVLLDIRDSRFIGNRENNHLAAFIAHPHREELRPRRSFIERTKIFVEIGNVGELADCPRHISHDLERSGHRARGRQRRYKLSREFPFRICRRELFYPRSVNGVDWLLRRCDCRRSDCRDYEERQKRLHVGCEDLRRV
jgi:hypothetical protein